MAGKTIYGKVHSYAGGQSVEFYFKPIDKKDIDKEDEALPYMGNANIPFEIWQKFKNAKVKITIEKV